MRAARYHRVIHDRSRPSRATSCGPHAPAGTGRDAGGGAGNGASPSPDHGCRAARADRGRARLGSRSRRSIGAGSPCSRPGPDRCRRPLRSGDPRLRMDPLRNDPWHSASRRCSRGCRLRTRHHSELMLPGLARAHRGRRLGRPPQVELDDPAVRAMHRSTKTWRQAPTPPAARSLPGDALLERRCENDARKPAPLLGRLLLTQGTVSGRPAAGSAYPAAPHRVTHACRKDTVV